MHLAGLVAPDLRFPTSKTSAGFHTVHVDPDYLPPVNAGCGITIREVSCLVQQYPDGAVRADERRTVNA